MWPTALHLLGIQRVCPPCCPRNQNRLPSSSTKSKEGRIGILNWPLKSPCFGFYFTNAQLALSRHFIFTSVLSVFLNLRTALLQIIKGQLIMRQQCWHLGFTQASPFSFWLLQTFLPSKKLTKSWYRSLKKDEQSEGIPFILWIFSPFGQYSVTDNSDKSGNWPAIDLCWNYLFSFFLFFFLSSTAKRGIYEIYQSWTAIEQESYSFASPLEAQAQKRYCEME